MNSIKGFAFGAFYLVSGVYSVGFSLVMSGIAQSSSGRTAYIPVPDGLFPFEVLAFALFGAVFIGAAFYHFRMSFRAVSTRRTEYGRRSLIK